MQKKTENKVFNDANNASNVNGTLNINSMQHLTTENCGERSLVLFGQRSVQEGFLVPGPKVQLLDLSEKSLVDAPKTSDKVQGYQEGNIYVISCEDQISSNAGHVLDLDSIPTSKLSNHG